ncbi:MAG: glutaredoxin domain-containing protein [Janthinobacterium lividum]
MNVTVYTAGPTCRRCTLTTRVLSTSGITYREIDLRENEEACAYVRDELGHVEAPVVVVTDNPHSGQDAGIVQHWSGFRPDRLTALVGLQASGPVVATSRTHPAETGRAR